MLVLTKLKYKECWNSANEGILGGRFYSFFSEFKIQSVLTPLPSEFVFPYSDA
jgi:hypothetical protein